MRIHGLSRTRLYNIWKGMHQRCKSPNVRSYPLYGGRGISVDPCWDDYLIFKDWAEANGYAGNLSIERNNSDLNYSPGNCTWADNSTQAANQRKRPNTEHQYIGVRPSRKRWKAVIDFKGVQTHLGMFSTEEEAMRFREDYITANNLPHKRNL